MASYLLSPALKLAFIAILMVIWASFVEPQILPLVTAVQWFFNQSLYKVVPLEALEFMWDVIVFWSSLKILLWVFAPGVHDTNQSGSDKAGSFDQNRSGFTTRSIYSN